MLFICSEDEKVVGRRSICGFRGLERATASTCGWEMQRFEEDLHRAENRLKGEIYDLSPDM